MNPFARFFELIGNPSHSRTLGILAILVIALAIPLTVNIAQKQQELRQQAAAKSDCEIAGNICTDRGCLSPADGSLSPLSCASNSTIPSTPPSVPPSPSTQPSASGVPTPPPTDLIAVCNGKGGVCSSSCNTGQTNVGGCPNGQVCCAGTIATPTTVACPTTEGFTGSSCTQGSSEQYLKGSCAPGSCSIQSCFKNPNASNYCSYNRGDCYPMSDAGAKCNNPTAPSPSPGTAACLAQGGYCVTSQCDRTTDTNLGKCTNTQVCCKVPAQNATGISCSEANVRCPANCSATTLPNGNYQCYTNATVFTANKLACEPTTCATAATPPPASSAPSAVQSVVVLSNLTLDGLGTAGDIRNQSQRPTNPQGGKRKAVVELTNVATGAVTSATQVTPELNSNGTFTIRGSFNNLPVANYTVRLKADGFLRKSYGVITLNAGETKTLTNPLRLIAGDLVVDGNNRVDALDFNSLSACFGEAGIGACSLADLDDTGVIDLFDFNLLLREFGQVGE